MFKNVEHFKYCYTPILALSLSEMNALQQLPDKDKDLILPVIPLKGWTTARKLSSSIDRLKKSIGNRKWIASLDKDFLIENKSFQFKGVYPREVFYEVKDLFNPNNGYDNWFNYLKGIPEAIPSLILDELTELDMQIVNLKSLDRGIVFIFDFNDRSLEDYYYIVNALARGNVDNILMIFDLGTVNKNYKDLVNPIIKVIDKTKAIIPMAIASISCTSFPSSFSGYENGENPIYERLLFNRITTETFSYRFIYSDRGSARIEKQKGGGGIPSPRIDYPLKNDWRFVRKEFEDVNDVNEGEKDQLYIECAKSIMLQKYWIPELHLWGTQMIELTAMGDKFGINSPQKSTAVRINLHLYTQLHYNDEIATIDTDEDWED